MGLSQVSGETLRKADAVTPVAAVQNLYNMLERDCETDIFPYCEEKGIGVVPFSPIASGFLSGKLNSTSQFEKVDDVRTWVPQLSQENMNGNRPIIDILNKKELKAETQVHGALKVAYYDAFRAARQEINTGCAVGMEAPGGFDARA